MLLPTDLRVGSDVVRVPWAICTLSTNCESEQSLHGIQAKVGLWVLRYNLKGRCVVRRQFHSWLINLKAKTLAILLWKYPGFYIK